MPLAPFTLPDGSPNRRAIVEMAAFNAAIYKNAVQSAQDILDLNGGGSIAGGEYQPDAFAPSWAVGSDSDGNVYIVFAGTTNIKQMVAHIGGALGVPYTEFDDDTETIHLETLVHPWWNLAWLTIKGKVMAAYASTAGGKQVRVTGHSYGGAIALLCAFHFAREIGGHRVELLTFAQPFVISRNYDGEEPHAIVRVVAEDDAVPSLGPQLPFYLIPFGFLVKQVGKRAATFGHFGKRVMLWDSGAVTVDDSQERLWLLRPGALTETVTGESHYMRNYCRKVRLMWNKGGIDQPTSTVASIGANLAEGSEVPEARVVRHADYQTLSEQARVYSDGTIGADQFAGGANRKITSRSLVVLSFSTDFSSRVIGDVSAPFFATIFDSENHMAASGLWKLTLVINNGKHGTSTSVVWRQPSSTIEQAIAKGKSLAAVRSNLLGSASLETDPAKSLANPRIEFLRVSDALNPRLSQLVEIVGATGAGLPSEDNAADVFSTALTVRLNGVSAGVAPRESISNHQIIGQPDRCVDKGRYDGTVVLSTSFPTFDSAMKQFLDYLTSPADNFGFMGQDTAEPIHAATTFTFNNLGKYQCVVTAHGYANRDRVRITAANAPGFNGVHLIQVVDANTFYLHSNLPESLALPTTAKVQRIQAASGVRKVEFYKFTRPAAGWVSPFGIKVSKKNLAREITGVSFRRKSR